MKSWLNLVLILLSINILEKVNFKELKELKIYKKKLII